MDVCIYYQQWDKNNSSHSLLKLAIRQYLKTQGKNCPGTLSVCKNDISSGDVRLEGDCIPDGYEFGKPYIKELPFLHFSISHSGPWWCCAISETRVGLDIQEERVRNQERLARRFFHPSEVSWLENHGFDQFCRLWAYKESYVKYTGTGLTKGMDYFSVTPEEAAEPGAADIFQTELSFRQNYYMVLTAEYPVYAELVSLRLDAQ